MHSNARFCVKSVRNTDVTNVGIIGEICPVNFRDSKKYQNMYRKSLNTVTLSMGNLTTYGDHIAIDSNEVLGELGHYFLKELL